MSSTQKNGTGVSAEFAQTNTNTPVNPNDIANKAYVDAVAQGLSPKGSCLVATAAALPAYTYNNGSSGIGATITANAVGALTVDGVTGFSVGDRILVKDETAGNAPNNGIYTVTNPGSGGAAFVLTRALDNDKNTEFPGAYTFIESGTVNAAAGFVCTNTTPPNVGVTAITWTQFTGAAEIIAGNGLTKSGNTLSVLADGTTIGVSASGIKVADGQINTTQLTNSGVTNAKLANMAANTIKGNNTGAPAAPLDLTVAQVNTMLGTLLANGSVPMSGNLDMGGNSIINTLNPITNQLSMFGDGADGGLSLGGDTTLTASKFIFRHSSITMNSHILTAADKGTAIYCSGTLAMGSGGKILCLRQADVARPAATTQGGRGGTGGGSGGFMEVRAKTITGTGSIDSSGNNGGNGDNAPGWTAGTTDGQSGTAGSTGNYTVYGTSYTGFTAAGIGSNTGGVKAGPAGGGPTAAQKLPTTDIVNWVYRNVARPDLTAANPLQNSGNSGASGSNGTGTAGGPAVTISRGGSGGGGGLVGAGAAGGDSDGSTTGTNTGSTGSSGGGAGGGGGGGGGVFVMSTSVPSTLTVTAKGGNGGNGGALGGPFLTLGNAGGGGGGGGGLAILIGNQGNTATVTAAGGTGGNAGGSGALGGGTGGGGTAMNLVGW